MFYGEHIRIEPYGGIIGCDARVPEHLKEYLNEMSTILKNIEMIYDDINDGLRSK